MTETPIQEFIDQNQPQTYTDGSYPLPAPSRLEAIENDLIAGSTEVPRPGLSASQSKIFGQKRTSETGNRSVLTASFLARHDEIYNDNGENAKKLNLLIDQDRAVGQVMDSSGALVLIADRGVLVVREGIQRIAGQAIDYVSTETASRATDEAGRTRQGLLLSAIQPVKAEWNRPQDKAADTRQRTGKAVRPIAAGITAAADAAAGVTTIDNFLSSVAAKEGARPGLLPLGLNGSTDPAQGKGGKK